MGIFAFVWYLVPETKGEFQPIHCKQFKQLLIENAGLTLEDMDGVFGLVRTDIVRSDEYSGSTSESSHVGLVRKPDQAA